MLRRLQYYGLHLANLHKWTAVILRVLPISTCTGSDNGRERPWDSLRSRWRTASQTLVNFLQINTQLISLWLNVDLSQWVSWSLTTLVCISVQWVNTVTQTCSAAVQKPITKWQHHNFLNFTTYHKTTLQCINHKELYYVCDQATNNVTF